MASEIVRMRSVARPVAKVMAAVGSAPKLLFMAPHRRRPSGQRQASQVRVLSAMRVGCFIVLASWSILVLVFTVEMDSCAFPPISQRTRNGWGTHSFVHT